MIDATNEWMPILGQLAMVALLVFLNGFFVAAEFALVKIRDSQLEPLILKGHRRARVARDVVNNLDASLSACQLGITLASLGLGWIGEPVFTALLDPVMNWTGVASPQLRHRLACLRCPVEWGPLALIDRVKPSLRLHFTTKPIAPSRTNGTLGATTSISKSIGSRTARASLSEFTPQTSRLFCPRINIVR